MAKRLRKQIHRLDAALDELNIRQEIIERHRQTINRQRLQISSLEAQLADKDAARVREVIKARTRLLSALETLTNELLSILSEVESRG